MLRISMEILEVGIGSGETDNSVGFDDNYNLYKLLLQIQSLSFGVDIKF